MDKGHYYVMRANALEDNLSLYIYVQGRRYLITEDTVKIEKGRWYTLKVECQGDHIKGYLDDKLLVDRNGSRYLAGQVGLWTKADSVTNFDDFRIIPYETSTKSR